MQRAKHKQSDTRKTRPSRQEHPRIHAPMQYTPLHVNVCSTNTGAAWTKHWPGRRQDMPEGQRGRLLRTTSNVATQYPPPPPLPPRPCSHNILQARISTTTNNKKKKNHLYTPAHRRPLSPRTCPHSPSPSPLHSVRLHRHCLLPRRAPARVGADGKAVRVHSSVPRGGNEKRTATNDHGRTSRPLSPPGVRLSPSRKQHIEHRHRTRVSSGPNALTWGEWMGDPPDAARGGPGGLVSRSAAGRRAALHGSSIGAGRTRPRHFARRTSICQPVIGLAPCGSRPERRSARHRTARLRAQRTPSFGSHHGGGVPHTAVAALDGRHWLGSRNRPCQRRSLAAVRHIAAPQVAFRHRTNARSRSGCASLAARRAPGPIFSPSAILALLSVEADVAHVVPGPFLPFFSKKGRRLRAPPGATATAAWWPSALASPGGSLATERLRDDPQRAVRSVVFLGPS